MIGPLEEVEAPLEAPEEDEGPTIDGPSYPG